MSSDLPSSCKIIFRSSALLPSHGTLDHSQFHSYAVEWNATILAYFFDNDLIYTRTPAEANLPTNPLFLILNTAVAWYWYPNASAIYPAYHHIDSVRFSRWVPNEVADGL